MAEDVLLGVARNAALLLALVLTFELVSRRVPRTAHPLWEVLRGVILGAIGVAIIAASFRLEEGIVFDTRSVLLGVSGLFFGTIPTVIAMAMTAVYRLHQGGTVAVVGVLGILASGGIGIAWRRVRKGPLARVDWRELYGLGIVVHVAMLLIMLLLPWETALDVLARISLPVLVIYPVATVLLGLLLVDRLEREETLRALTVSEERYRTLFENQHAVMFIVDPEDLSVVDANPAAARFYGWSRDELRSMTVADLNTLSVPEIRAEIDRARHHERPYFLFRHRLADGSIRDVQVFSGPVEIGGRQLLYSIVHDISEQRKAEEERERLQSQLIQAQKMESVGRLAGGVAHDFNNMLAVILGRTELALDVLGPDTEVRTELEEVRTAATRSADLTRQLLAFAREQVVAPKVIDLNETVARTLKMLERLIGEDMDLAWHPGRGLWPVKVDPVQIDQILANLMVNARDAISGVGLITIRTANVPVTADDAVVVSDAEPGDYVLLEVSDDGHGIPEEVRERIFDPFFTTKGPGQGTGLGLATVYGIVRQNGGFIGLSSEPGRGTSFRIHLPRASGDVFTRAEAPGTGPGQAGGSATILVVEDQPAVLELAATILRRNGYTVLEAETPADALDLAARHASPIHLLLTDVVMPDMNGVQLAEQLETIHPGIAVLFMSGYTADVIAHRGVLKEGIEFLEKPFSVTQLAGKVREVLDTAR